MARIESGAEAFTLQPVPLAEAVLACLRRHGARAEGKQQRLEVECAGAVQALDGTDNGTGEAAPAQL